MDKLISDIQELLSNDLLKPEYISQNKKNRFWGHCYVSTETLYHLLDDEMQKKFKPAILKIGEITHWFLKNSETGEIIDVTKDQFDHKLSYENAKFCSFLTKTPSKRSLILINRIYAKNNC
jgi:hypothetical protein